MNLKMRRLTWFMRKHSEGKAHWVDEGRPWNPFLLSDVRRDGMPFVFIIHHPSIVFQSVNGRRAIAICMLIISLATWSPDWDMQEVCVSGSFHILVHWIDCRGDIFCRLVGSSDFQSTELISAVIQLLIFSAKIKLCQQAARKRVWTL